MGCVFGCFRFRDDLAPQNNPGSQPITAIAEEPADFPASNSLWSTLIPKAEEGDPGECKDERDGVTGSPSSDKALRDQAKFLIACGTLSQIPAEIRHPKKLKDSKPHSEDADSTFHSRIPDTAIEKPLMKQPDQLQSPVKLLEEWENGSESLSHSSNSCIMGKNTDSSCTSSPETCEVGHTVKDTQPLNSSTSYTPMGASTQYKNKSVRFEGQSDASSFSSRSSSTKITSQNLKPFGSPGDQSVPKPSPYPTPLKLTDDMKTPGTVFPSYVYNKENGNNPRIRLQYVYSGVIPQNFSPEETRTQEASYDNCSAPIEEDTDKHTPKSQVKVQASASKNESNAAATFASWLPSNSIRQGHNDKRLIPIGQGFPDPGRTPGDIPILGMAAAHWNADGTPLSPKWWGVNGIPNTTNKYKEDQKVSWHATPFEERLEKALTEDHFIKDRKQVEQTLPLSL